MVNIGNYLAKKQSFIYILCDKNYHLILILLKALAFVTSSQSNSSIL